MTLRRIRITLAYDGTEFHGWQVQPGLPTIQGVLEEIIGGMEGKPVHVAGSGRTDAGVHALAQVAAFTIANPIPVDNLQRAVNRLLPPAIRILDAVETHAGFSSPVRRHRQNLSIHSVPRAGLPAVSMALRAPSPLSAE